LHKKIDFFLQVFIFVLNFAQNYVTLLDSYNAVNEDNSRLRFFIQPNCIFFRKNVNFLIFSHFSHLFQSQIFHFPGREITLWKWIFYGVSRKRLHLL